VVVNAEERRFVVWELLVGSCLVSFHSLPKLLCRLATES
jgi:hypothetical protein